MGAGEVLQILAALAALATALGGGLYLSRGDGRWERISRWSALLTLALLTAVLAIMAYLFLASDLSVQYVWSHSSTGTEPFYKLVGVWAGGEGGLLLWAWFMALAVSVETLLERRRGLSPRFSSAFRMAAGSIVLLFVLIVMAADMFAATASTDLLLHPQGLGMSLSLQTLEMAVHPPLVFAAYAFSLAVFAASLARFITLEQGWSQVALPWARLTALLLVMGIVVGAIWAYYELGWGGFWVWDPVETASLLPFLAVMAFLHAQRSTAARKGYLLPFLGMLTLVYVLASSFITRTGGIWGSSVHTYGSTLSGSTATRFITVLMEDRSVMGLLLVIVLLMVLGLALSYRMSRREAVRVEDGVLGTVALLLMFSALLLLLLIRNVGLDQGANFIEFTEKTTYLLALVLIALVSLESSRKLGRRRALLLGAVVGLASIALALASSLTGALPLPVAIILPPAVATIIASAFRVAVLDRTRLRRWLRGAGPSLAHIGLAIVLLGFIFSSYYQASLPEDREAIDIGNGVQVGGHTVQLQGLSTQPWTTPTGEAGEVRTATFTVSGQGSARTVSVTNHYQNTSSGDTLLQGGTAVINGLVEDVYISFDWMGNGTALVQVRVLPMVSMVWFGSALLIGGMTLTLLTTSRREENIDRLVRS